MEKIQAKVTAWYEEKFVLSPAEEHRYAPRVVGMMWEGTVPEGEKVADVYYERFGEVKAMVQAEVAGQQQAARETAEPVGPVRVEPEPLDPRPLVGRGDGLVSADGPPPDPAEVPDAEAWFGNYCKGMRVSDMSKKDIEFYLGSGIVKNAEAGDTRVHRFKLALEYWHGRAGDRRKGGR